VSGGSGRRVVDRGCGVLEVEMVWCSLVSSYGGVGPCHHRRHGWPCVVMMVAVRSK
jgi:hypothetical protein